MIEMYPKPPTPPQAPIQWPPLQQLKVCFYTKVLPKYKYFCYRNRLSPLTGNSDNWELLLRRIFPTLSDRIVG